MPRHIYWKDRPIGHGGGGTVYQGSTRFEHAAHERRCAIKMMHESMAEDPVSISRFHREAIVGYELAGHSNLVGTRTFGASPEGLPYLVMDLEGPTFDDLDMLMCGDFPVIRVVAAGVLGALRTLHEHGWVHGDVNPGNIFLGRDGAVKLGDFGKSMSPRAAVDADHGLALGRRDDRRGLALVLAYLATGAIPTTHDGALQPLPESVPDDLRELIHGLVAPLDQGGLAIEQAQAHIDQYRPLFATREVMLALLREGEALRESGARELRECGESPESPAEPRELCDSDQLEARAACTPACNAAPDRPRPSSSASRPAGPASAPAPAAETETAAILARILERIQGGDSRPRPERRTYHAPALASACLIGAAVSALLLGLRDPRVESVRVYPMETLSAPTRHPAPAVSVVDHQPAAEPEASVLELPRQPRAEPTIAPRGEATHPVRPRAGHDIVDPEESAAEDTDGSTHVEVIEVEDHVSDKKRARGDANYLLTRKAIHIAGTAESGGVELLVDRGVWVGPDAALLKLRIHNSSSSNYRIAVLTLRDAHGEPVASEVIATHSVVRSRDLLIVPQDIEGLIALHASGVRHLSGQDVSLEISEPGGRRRIEIQGMRWP